MRTYQPGSGPVARAAVSRLATGTAVSLALPAVNALGYLLTVLAARLLGPAVFGELAALLGLAMIGTVPAGALQAAVALRAARADGADGSDTAATRRRIHSDGVVTTAVTVLVAALAAPLLSHVLRLGGVAPVLGVAALLVPSTLVAAYDGILQGERRMRRLALLLVVFGTAKTAGGIAGLLLGGTPGAVLAGMACGAAVGAAASWAGCGRPGLQRGRRPGADVLRAGGSVLGFVLLWNLDVLLARALLTAPEAGLYAVGSVVFKIAFWLPQGIGVLALPRLADARRRAGVLTRAVLVVAGLGAPLVLGAALAGPVLTGLLCGGDACAPVAPDLWLFALLGTLMAAGQLMVFSGIARCDARSTLTVWAVAVLEAAGAVALAAAGALSVPALCLVATAAAVLLIGSEAVRGPAADRAPARG